MQVWVAEHPLGPWTYSGTDINPTGAGRACDMQNSFAIQIPPRDTTTSSAGADLGTVVFVGDRWMSAADHLKSHDLQFWFPLAFNDSGTEPTASARAVRGGGGRGGGSGVGAPTIAPMRWVDSFQVDV